MTGPPQANRANALSLVKVFCLVNKAAISFGSEVIHPVKLACEANNPDLEFVKFWTPKSNKFLIGIASKPLVDR